MLAYQMFFSISLQDGWPIKMVEEQYLVNLFHSLVWKLRERDSSDTWKKDFQYIYIYILYIYIYIYIPPGRKWNVAVCSFCILGIPWDSVFFHINWGY